MSTYLQPITPSRYKIERKKLRDATARLIGVIGEIRRLRATGKILDREEADGLACLVWHEHNQMRRMRRLLRDVAVVKNCHLSPNAKARFNERNA